MSEPFAAAAQSASAPDRPAAPDVRCFSVGPIQENAYFVRAEDTATSALLVDPGEEAQRLLDGAHALGVEIEAILVTHCHFDHVGAVAPVARATGAPVYCPEIEVPVLADIMKWTMPGFGPFESWQAEHSVAGGERLALAGLDVEVIFTPGHSPGHVTYAISRAAGDAAAGTARGQDDDAGRASTGASAHAPAVALPVLLSGDVLFQGSVGRVDLPGGDWPTLERSIAELIRRFPAETAVHPGHMGATTLGRELQTNPFLAELRAGARAPSPA
jgi:glyoxylase-like metal-dependent hydrolase (beta-lactamase superfamily II)